jgi:hypothetical protein
MSYEFILLVMRTLMILDSLEKETRVKSGLVVCEMLVWSDSRTLLTKGRKIGFQKPQR